MTKRCRVLVLACLVLCAGCKSPNPSRLQPGDEAPPLVVSQWAQGGPVDVTDGQRIYVLEFFASWCPWCRMQEGRLSRLQERYADRGVQFVAITNESAEDIGAYLAEGGGDFDLPVAVDDNGTTFALYGPQKIPRVFVIGQDGIIAYEGHPGSPAFVATLNQLTR